jgi:Na+-driven multidrug efflux pump
MAVPDDEFYWDWYKHEENLTTNRGSFFLIGQSMLFAAYATLRAATTPRPTIAISLIGALGIFVACTWLLVSVLHNIGTRKPLIVALESCEPRRAAISRYTSSRWKNGLRSSNLMGIFLPVGILAAWIVLLAVQGT